MILTSKMWRIPSNLKMWRILLRCEEYLPTCDMFCIWMSWFSFSWSCLAGEIADIPVFNSSYHMPPSVTYPLNISKLSSEILFLQQHKTNTLLTKIEVQIV